VVEARKKERDQVSQPVGQQQDAAPAQQAALGSRDAGNIADVSLPLSENVLATKIAQCKKDCSCKIFDPPKVAVITDYDAPQHCKPQYPNDPEFSKCIDAFTEYRKQANAYNELSKKTCPQNYPKD
jgi:hypothetical protein